MPKKLTRHGNSLALVIDRPILDLLKIDPETPLDGITYGKHVIVTPVEVSGRSEHRRQIRTHNLLGAVQQSALDRNCGYYTWSPMFLSSGLGFTRAHHSFFSRWNSSMLRVTGQSLKTETHGLPAWQQRNAVGTG
jgi:hypothetical protein